MRSMDNFSGAVLYNNHIYHCGCGMVQGKDAPCHVLRFPGNVDRFRANCSLSHFKVIQGSAEKVGSGQEEGNEKTEKCDCSAASQQSQKSSAAAAATAFR